MFNFIVTCHTLGCVNEGKKIPMTTETDSIVFMCGPCNNVISDIERAL